MSAPAAAGSRVRRPGLRVHWGLIALAIVLLLAVGVSGSIMFPPRTSVHTAIKTMHYNRGGIVVNPHTRGCGTYWNTAHVGYGVGATVQIAAGFCWNGKDVRWTWGLRRNDCSPRSTVMVVVDMTCRITGGHNGGYMDVRYEAHIRSAIIPYMQTTVVREVLITPQGYLLQIPGQA